ncbi:MAG: right-handed parallel beta-helix repeat-containing protein [Euryarchaeota archaeon]|nr:right-handed parallel beta-helix repeat-containing protein [Euryarchaeota archaeon]
MRGYIIVLTILMFTGTVSAGTLHVPANYTSIQEAIDSAESGDTIHVSKKVYCECIIINKPLTLLGDHAMIRGSDGRDVVTVGADGVTVSGFMIEGGMVGINIFASSESIIENNRINNNIYGINMLDADNSIIMDNMIMNNHGHGISMQNASKNIIVENLILCNSGDGIRMGQSADNVIIDNILPDLSSISGGKTTDLPPESGHAIQPLYSTGNVIQADVIENVSISHSNDTIIDNRSPVIEHITIVAPMGIVVSTECMPDNTTGNMVDNIIDQKMGVCANGDEILYVPTDYPTIQSAIEAATNGDTIYVYNGTYMENLVVDKEVTLQGEDRSNTVIDGNGGNVVSIKSPYVSINGFTIRNGGYGIYMAVGRDCKITDCDIHSNIHGIYFWRACRDNIISDCILHSNTNNGIFIFMSSSNNSITDCTAYLNGNNGIMLQKACSNNIVVNCDASSNQQNGICIFQVCAGNTIRDCSAHSNKRSGILIQKICAGNTVVGCETNSNQQNGICVFQVCDNNMVTDCSAAKNTVSGIFVSHACSGNAVTDCNSSESVNGIHVSHASAANMVIGCDTPGNINGIFISHASTENMIQGCDTGSNVRRGIFIAMSSKENKIINCVVGSAPYGVVLSRSSTGNTITGSTVGTTSLSDLMVEYASSGTVIESTFDTAGVSLASTLTVKNYLDVLVLNGTDTNPHIQGADVIVTDDGQAIHASAGYGGTDSATDHAGRCSGILVTDRIYRSNVATENTTLVSVKHGAWEEADRGVCMLESHTEVFTKLAT